MPRASKPKQPKAERQPSVVTSPRTPNPRHEIVANAILEGHSEADALRAAGYHPASGSNVMRTENVQQILAEAREEISDLTTIKRLDVLNMFLDAIEMARTMADPGNMINGADKVAKMMGYYAPEVKKIEHTVDQNVLKAKYQQMTDEELMEIAAGRAKVVEGEVIQ